MKNLFYKYYAWGWKLLEIDEFCTTDKNSIILMRVIEIHGK